MKKIYNTLVMMAIVAMTATFTSCDEDAQIAYTLEGTWRGNMYVSSYYDGRTYTATATEITFLRDPYRYSSGEGYWVDRYIDAPWKYIANHIRWSVNNRQIWIYFVEEGNEVYIYDYHLNDNHFTGWLEDGDNDVEFNLVHISSPNWNEYTNWGYDGWYNNYYSRETRSIDGDSTTAKPVKPVRRIGKPE